MSGSMRQVNRRAWIRQMGLAAAGLSLGVGLRAQDAAAEGKRSILSRYPELKYINLAGNENPFGPSRKVSMAIMQEVSNSCRYPFREEEILKDRIAEMEGVLPENILLGNGCDEILSLAGDVYGRSGSAIVATRPTYLQLMHYAESNGAHVEWVDHTPSMHHDLTAMLDAARKAKSSIAYICNPDTPTGTMLPKAEVESFCREATKTCPVFVDEVYLDLLEDFREQTQVGLVREGLPVIIGRSFSKMHGLAGHRVGYAIASKEIVEEMGSRKMSSLSYLGVIAATASLDDEAFHKQSVRLISAGREKYCKLLSELGLAYTPSVGNFVFHKTGIEIRAFQKLMKDRGFLVGRPFPPYEYWCRISIGSQNEMAQYETAMREVFA